MWTERWIKPIDVERDVHLIGKRFYDLFAERHPGLALMQARFQIFVEERVYAAIQSRDASEFLCAEVTNADLDDLGDVRDVLRHVVHDGRV